MDIEAAFEDIAPAIEALRALTALPDFRDAAPEPPLAEAKAKLAEAEAAFTPLAAELNARLAAIARALNAAEAPKGPASFGAKLLQAQKQRTGGPPYPLTTLLPDAPANDWPGLITQAEGCRRAFAHWFSTYEGFRKHADHRMQQAGK